MRREPRRTLIRVVIVEAGETLSACRAVAGILHPTQTDDYSHGNYTNDDDHDRSDHYKKLPGVASSVVDRMSGVRR